MSFDYLNNLNNSHYMPVNTSFRAESSSVEKTKQTSENPIDTFVRKVDEEKEKKHNKKAIAVTGSVIGISLLVAILNPKVSGKLIEKLKASQLKVNSKIKTSKNDFFKSKFYQFLSKAQNGIDKFLSYSQNVNSLKDTYFKQICTEESSFTKIRNGSRGFWEKTAKVFRKIMKKPHEAITRWSDKLAQFTVKRNYKKATEKMDILEKFLKEYGEKLPADKKSLFEAKIRELQVQRGYFEEGKLLDRFKEQEKLMENLDRDVRRRFRNYKNGFQNRFVDNREHFRKNYSFWAEEIMQPAKENVNKQGKLAVDALFGNKEGTKGTYNEIVELLSQNISKEEADIIKNTVNKTEKSLRNANISECSEYFDKKRDLVLGSAPTDVVSAAILLCGSGVAIAAADNRDERISETITNTIPIIAGVGTSTALTSMLVSGSKGLIIGGLAGGIMSLIGSRADHFRLKAKAKIKAEQENAKKETQNA